MIAANAFAEVFEAARAFSPAAFACLDPGLDPGGPRA
jgi:hypothetical protein